MMRTFLLAVVLAPLAAHAAPTGVLDLDMSERGGKWVVADSAYEVAFPFKPDVTMQEGDTPDHKKLQTASVMFASGNEVYGYMLIPVPKDTAYDEKKGMDGARDGALANVGGKIVKEEPVSLGGLKGRRTVAKAAFQGADLLVDLDIAWDAGHHTLIALFTATSEKAMSATQTAFLASLKVNAAGKAPPAKIR